MICCCWAAILAAVRCSAPASPPGVTAAEYWRFDAAINCWVEAFSALRARRALGRRGALDLCFCLKNSRYSKLNDLFEARLVCGCEQSMALCSEGNSSTAS